MQQRLTTDSFNLLTTKDALTPIAHLGIKKIPAKKIYLLEYTWVSFPKRHQGLAEQLITAFMQEMKLQGCQVLPLCPYAKKYFAQHPEFNHQLIIK
ncbi:hypothetical protein FC89_GL000776 [Liquorilactobacillus ghanensis DSM 18630]|uniref:N-acetyltransferase domain-containing protein n=1 Tax=Liquorilactobacillus ghanensis DSM 18630 TaxID=1423750 RepID=A0A0R1VLA8_9LACO|nr:GNAT family N-acetyltransferase [Liquorilactobacillus ghanensis]KRM06622.1 hypothetical protein FC89_GL000776 [Liquorilactobacillus ghanensis DSM 18630]